MTNLKKAYLTYLQALANKKMPLTKQFNDEKRQDLTNHRAVAGINRKSKSFSYTPIAKHFEGTKMTDIDGNVYQDISMGFGVHLFGHHPAFITEKIHAANQQSWGLGPYHESMFDLAEKMKKLTGVERLSFFNSGTEAIMVAIRLARAHTNKRKIVIFKGAYHGHNNSTLVFKTNPMSGQPLALIPGIPESTQADTFLLDFDDEASLTFIEEHADEIAAVLNEPVQSRHPACQPKAFHQKLREITTKHHIALIFDEMITGFRIGPGGAQAHFGVKADLVTYGKVIGGGMPIGIVGGKAEYLDMIDGGRWSFNDDSLPNSKRTFVAGTFCNHPLSMAAAGAVVDKLLAEGEQLTSVLNERTNQFVAAMNGWMEQEKIPIKFSNFGSLFRVEVPSTAKLYFHHLLLEGLYIWEGKTCFLSTVHTDQDIEEITHIFKKCALLLKACGFFPSKVTQKFDNQLDEKLSVANNIGVSIEVTGLMHPANLALAFRWLCLSTSKLMGVDVKTCMQLYTVELSDDQQVLFNNFIALDHSQHGIGFLIIEQGEKVSQFALVVHKSKLDGWSLTVLLNRLMMLYLNILAGNSLPMNSTERLQIAEEQGQAMSSQAVYPMKKQSYVLAVEHRLMRKAARKLKIKAGNLYQTAFAFAAAKILTDSATELVVGVPVAAPLKEGKKEVLGTNTVIETWAYTDFTSFKNCLNSAERTSKKPTCIFNIDRIIGAPIHPDFTINVIPLDPPFIRYDLVVNIVLDYRYDALRIDVKWRENQFSEQQISQFIETFNQLIQDAYEIVSSD